MNVNKDRLLLNFVSGEFERSMRVWLKTKENCPLNQIKLLLMVSARKNCSCYAQIHTLVLLQFLDQTSQGG